LAPTESSTTLLSLAIGATAFTTSDQAVTNTGTFSTETRRFTAWMPVWASACVSRTIASIFRPFTPPAALTASSPHCAAFTWSWP
jgi:hypothetical protein